jgi:hypothetical protein
MGKIIPLFGVGISGKSPNITAQRRLCAYYEFQKYEDKTKVSIIGTPGLTAPFVSIGDTPVRGMIAVGSLLYVVHRDTFYEVNNAGIKTSRGTLNTTTGKVGMATNGTQIIVTDGTNGYFYTISTLTFAVISDADYPDAATTVTWQATYFMVENTNRFYISAQNDGSSWDALDFATAEAAPDALVRIIADHGEIVLFGSETTEFWGNTGAVDFPWANVQGSTLEIGLAAKWSLAKFDDSLAFLGKNRLGQVQVMRLNGYTAVPISDPELDHLINAYATTADATAFSYMLGGHPMYQINFPGAGKSWLYDSLASAQAGTPVWSQLESGLSGGRHRAEIAVDFINKVRVSDYATGDIYTIDPTVYTDNGTAIPFELISRHMTAEYDRLTVDRVFIDFEAGVGLATGQGSNPQAMLQVSRDGGHSWGNEMWTTLGAIGEYKTRAEWRRFGTATDFVFKVRVTDPVKRVIAGAALDAERGAS